METLYTIIVGVCGFALALYWAFVKEEELYKVYIWTIVFFLVLFAIGVISCPELFKQI
ncbi:MAG: hypothetical protein II453_19560 [Alphaproteobacteria bacterium]|nr:hypothetical protein [Alphaproteobacteria bacterium]